MKSQRVAAWIQASLILFLFAGAGSAQDHAHHHGHHGGDPAEVVSSFHAALAAGDRAAALAHLDPQVLIFESGGAELSRDEYASHHLGSDMAFSQATERTVVDQRKDSSGDVAWVLTRSTTKGTYRDREIDAKGTETMVLRHSPEGWRIVHIHWSSR